MSKLQDLINEFETLSTTKLNDALAKQQQYKSARTIAIAISAIKTSDWPYRNSPDADGVYRSDPSVKTVGDLFKVVYPKEEGGIQNLPSDPITYSSTISTLKDPDTGAKAQYDILKSTYIAVNTVNSIKSAKQKGLQSWFDSFMTSAISYCKNKKIKVSDFSNLDDFEDEINSLSNNTWSFSVFSDIITKETLHQAFLEAGDNYQSTQTAALVATQSTATQSTATQSTSISGDYTILVKEPKSDNDKKIKGYITLGSVGPKISVNSELSGLPNPWTNPVTNQVVPGNTGTITYSNSSFSSGTDKDLIADTVINNLKSIIQDKYGVDIALTYTQSNLDPVSTTQSATSSLIAATPSTTATQSNFDATGIKVKLLKKSGPGELIGVTEQVVNNGFIDFSGLQFDVPGDYIISIIAESVDVENTEVAIKVLPEDEVIAQEPKQDTDDKKNVEGTRPIIAQIDKPTIELKPIEFDATNNNQVNSEIGSGLGFTPFFWYNGFQIDQRYITSLDLYYDGLVPGVRIVFIDSMGIMKKDGFPLDDTKFEIFLNSGSKNIKSIHLKFKLKEFQENRKKTYTITGILDLKDFYKIRYQSYKGTSFETLRKISSELGVGFNSNIVNTNDSMTWVNNGKLFPTFISDIITHSYISDTNYVLGYIDYYYCFNYVDIEKEWKRDISKDVGIASTGLNYLNSKDQVEKVERLVLTNDKSQNSSPFNFTNYKVLNNSTKTSITKGHFLVSKVYDSLSKQFLVFDVDSQTSDPSKNIILKGAPADKVDDNFRTRYSGKMDIENVHKQYYYAETQNRVNFDNLCKVQVDLDLPNANFNLYKFMKIQLNFINMKVSINNDEISQKRLTGEWIITDISYSWRKGGLTQKVTAVRKELSKTEEEIKNDNTAQAPQNENKQINENPVTPTPIKSTATPPNSAYKIGQSYIVQNSSGKQFRLTVNEILPDGVNVKATIKNI